MCGRFPTSHTAVNRLDDPLVSTCVANRSPGEPDPAGYRRLGDEPVPRSSVFGTTFRVRDDAA